MNTNPSEIPRATVDVVIPVYRNCETLNELYRKLVAELESLDTAFRIIFVVDACPDGSAGILSRLGEQDRRITVLCHHRNRGQATAIRTGLAASRAEAVIVMDADLQDDPALIPSLLAQLAAGNTAVFVAKHGAYESLPRRVGSYYFRYLLHLVFGISSKTGGYMVFGGSIRSRLLEAPAWPLTSAAVAFLAGGKTAALPVVRPPRLAGRSTYTSLKRWKLAVATVIWLAGLKWKSVRRNYV